MPLENQSSAILEFLAKRTVLAAPEPPSPRRIASEFTRRHQTRPLDTRLRKILTDRSDFWRGLFRTYGNLAHSSLAVILAGRVIAYSRLSVCANAGFVDS